MGKRVLKPGEKRKVIPKGYEVRKALGRDEVTQTVRIELVFTVSEWDEIEDQALGEDHWPGAWIKVLVLKRIGKIPS